MGTITITAYDDNGDSTELTLPARWVICPACDGHGQSSAHLGAFTWDEIKERGIEFEEDYFSGQYDRPCDQCHSTGKAQEVDIDRLSPPQAKALHEVRQAEYDEREAARHERRMLGGWQ